MRTAGVTAGQSVAHQITDCRTAVGHPCRGIGGRSGVAATDRVESGRWLVANKRTLMNNRGTAIVCEPGYGTSRDRMG